MITKFKIFECVCREPEIGDYVLITYEKFQGVIGKIIHYSGERYDIEFEGIYGYYGFHRNNIKFWSENKEDLETILATNKYNL